MKISVIGLGYVGLPLSALLSKNYNVIGFDVDSLKIKAIVSGEFPIKEPGLDYHLSSALSSGRLEVTNDSSKISNSQVKIITVGTPYDVKTGFIDYSQLENSLNVVIPHLNTGDVVILKSTVPPGTTMGLVREKIESYGLRVPDEIGLVFSPERMIEGQAIMDFETLPKIIGASDDRSFKIAKEIIGGLGGKVIRVSKPETAETIKMVDNYSRYVFLGLVNELAIACEKIGVDVLEVIRSAKEDYPRNAGLLVPGPGVGGSCLNKDPFIFSGLLRNTGVELEMVKSASRINSTMPGHVADLVRSYRKAGTVVILGVAFKGDTDDTRFTPAFTIKEQLIAQGFVVRMTDPLVSGEGINSDVYASCSGSDIVVLVTDHSEYRNLDLLMLKKVMNSSPLIIDTRGIVDRSMAISAGFEYHGLGRL
ncbi:MAG: nucleotide sugar dehydrogenase [Candidatus Thermoplasmatota archaeon]|nr:nucleotide sugar dehydrogenase [Candidatus Thermoplasmatota archaeon]